MLNRMVYLDLAFEVQQTYKRINMFRSAQSPFS